MSMYLISSNNLHTILSSVLCKKNEAILSKIPCCRGASSCVLTNSSVSLLCVRQFPYDHVVCSANHSVDSGNDINKMAATFCTSTHLLFRKLFERIWNNYVDIEQKITQVRFIISLSTRGYNSLGDLTRQHRVWRKILLNTNSWYLTEAFKNMHTLPSD